MCNDHFVNIGSLHCKHIIGATCNGPPALDSLLSAVSLSLLFAPLSSAVSVAVSIWRKAFKSEAASC